MSNKAVNETSYKNEYIPGILKVGRLTTIIAIVASFLPVAVLSFVYGITPNPSQIFTGFISMAGIVGLFWIVEPIAYFPILGLPGTFLSFLSGNIGNLRIPCAVAAIKAAGMETGTEESSIIATIGIAVSIVVNIVLLTICVLTGKALLTVLPESVMSVLNYLLPSLFGAVFAQFAVKNFKIAGVAMAFAIPMTLLLKTGKLSFLPGLPNYAVVLVCVFGTILIARRMYKEKEIKTS